MPQLAKIARDSARAFEKDVFTLEERDQRIDDQTHAYRVAVVGWDHDVRVPARDDRRSESHERRIFRDHEARQAGDAETRANRRERGRHAIASEDDLFWSRVLGQPGRAGRAAHGIFVADDRELTERHVGTRDDAHCLGDAADPNLVSIYPAATDAAKLNAFLTSTDLASAMRGAGVKGPPHIVAITPVEDLTVKDRPLAGVIVRHEVSDYAAWKRAFDGHADARARAGVIGHAVNRTLAANSSFEGASM